jgi:hypothetical protein
MDIKDKINTILLCDIAIHLGIDTDIDPQLVKYAVSSGNDWVLKAEYSSLDVDEPSKEDRDFVTAVLNMYRGLSNAFRKLSDDEQKELIRDHHLKVHDGAIQLQVSTVIMNAITSASLRHIRNLIDSPNSNSPSPILIHIQNISITQCLMSLRKLTL